MKVEFIPLGGIGKLTKGNVARAPFEPTGHGEAPAEEPRRLGASVLQDDTGSTRNGPVAD